MKRASCVLALVAGFLFGGPGCRREKQSVAISSQSRQPILEIDAAREPGAPLLAATSRNAPTWHGSRTIVFDDGSVQYSFSEWRSCASDCPNYGWLYQWDDSQEHVFTGMVERTEMNRLRALLDHEGKDLEGYANQGPQVGDFQILIHGASGRQSGAVVFGLQPAWSVSRPYVDLICESKTIAQRLTTSATIPYWCSKSNK